MKNVLEALYYGNIHESERKVGKLAETEEYKKYYECIDKLTATFTKEQNELFAEFLLWAGGYDGVNAQRTYANGVKLGMALALELVDFDPSFLSEE